MDITAIVLAGGSGSRTGADKPKQYLLLGNKPVISHSLEVFESHPLISGIVVIVPENDVGYCHNEIIRPFGYKKLKGIESGGANRQESSYLGVLAAQSEYVMIHDAARPFINADLIDRLAKSLKISDAVIPAVMVSDTIKYIEPQTCRVASTPDRSRLVAAQTPQSFRRELILKAHLKAKELGFQATDDASLIENAGGEVLIIDGLGKNMKITSGEDIVIAEALSKSEEAYEKR